MRGFSGRRKPKKMIGLNRFKDFLLLIIVMKSSEFLTKLFIRGVKTFSLNLKMARLQGSFLSFYLLFFFVDNALPLLFPHEKLL